MLDIPEFQIDPFSKKNVASLNMYMSFKEGFRLGITKAKSTQINYPTYKVVPYNMKCIENLLDSKIEIKKVPQKNAFT